MWKWSDLKRLLKRSTPRLDTADLGAVMWPVSYPNPEDPSGGTAYVPKHPHITVVVFKDINNPDLGFTREDVMDAVAATDFDVYLWMKPTGIEWFGEEQDIPVLRVEHEYLERYREAIIQELDARGIPYDKTFPEYKPHVSIPVLAALDNLTPPVLLAKPVEVWWGNEHYKMPADSSLLDS